MVALSIVMIGCSIYFIFLNTKAKSDYEHLTGKITYLEKSFGEYPSRNMGKYRYLNINNYAHVFEIYADEQSSKIDSLNNGDIVTAYFYETNSTNIEGINRYLQYLEKDNIIFYKKTSFSIIIGFVLIILAAILIMMSYIFYKQNKISY